jgi:hypothetical protein
MLAALPLALALSLAPQVATSLDSTRAPRAAAIAVTPVPASLVPPATPATQRPRAVRYSDLYYTRLKIHRIASYAILPLFAAEYVVGTRLQRQAATGDHSLKDLHGTITAGVTGLFVLNTVTGGWNLWESRHDPNGRTRRWIHSALMLVADAGFAATGAAAPDDDAPAGSPGTNASTHRTLAEISMSAALASWVMMLAWKD